MAADDEAGLSGPIKKKAFELGFQICGIARSRKLEEREPVISSWLSAGMNDKMNYLGRNLGQRLDPGLFFQGSKSLVVTGLSYYSEKMQEDPDAPVLSRYTYGHDYHQVIIPKLEKLLEYIQEKKPGTRGRAVSDSSYVLEKAWAVESGLGWQGRHSIVINTKIGSFFFIGILILDLELDYDEPFNKDLCGNCRICIDECPTSAINGNRTVDARKCIANLTIENRGPIPSEIIPLAGRRVYGCDRCQEVCPWNTNIKPGMTLEFTVNPEIASMTHSEWQSLTKERFEILFKDTAIERVGYESFIRNIRDVTGIVS